MSVAFGGGVGRIGGGGGCRGGGSGGGRQNRRRPRRRRPPNPGLNLTVFVDLSPEYRGAVVGRGGSNIRDIQDVSGAIVKVPPAGRGGRIRVQGPEGALLSACRRIAESASTVMADSEVNLECTVDAGSAGRMMGTMCLPKDGETLLFRADSGGDTAGTGAASISYTAHSVGIDPAVTVTQDDVDTTLDNLSFARGADLQPVYACVKDRHIFVSGIITDSVDLTIREMIPLATGSKVEGGAERLSMAV